MTVTRSVKELFPGFGQVTDYVKSDSVNNPINTTTTTVLTPAMLASFRSGRVRVRGFAYPGAGAGQCTAIKITATDGTTTYVLGNIATFAASEFFDFVLSFGPLEIAATSVSVAITMANVANGQLTADLELAVNP